jgi:hypothetical protein
MAGCLIRRALKAAVRDAGGSVIAFPYLSHRRAGLSHAEWRALSPGEKLERLFGMSLDDLYEIMSWEPIGELDPFRLSVLVRGKPACRRRVAEKFRGKERAEGLATLKRGCLGGISRTKIFGRGDGGGRRSLSPSRVLSQYAVALAALKGA